MIIKGKQAKKAAYYLAQSSTTTKNNVLIAVAEALSESEKEILNANETDMENAAASKLQGAILDRLLLTPERIKAMAEGLKEIAMLEDPVGEILSMKKRPNGLSVGQKRVPFGVIGIIYESSTNVTVDVFGL